MRSAFSSPPGQTRSAVVWTLAGVLAVALVLRVSFALHKGLVLDEFHSLFHATRPDAAAFLATLRLDNHPPLSFLLIRGARELLGDGALALRTPAILFGLAELLVVYRIARRVSPRAALGAAALLSVSSLHLDFSTQVRMYALHGLCVTGLTAALLACLGGDPPGGGGRRADRALVGLWTVLGMHTHYFFMEYLGVLGLTLALVAWLEPRHRRSLAKLAPVAGLAALACLPWYLTGFRSQVAHGLPPGGDDLGPAGLGEALVHLLFLNVRLGGPFLRVVFIACGGAALALGAVGLRSLVRRDRTLALVLGATAFGVPLAAAAVASVLPRAGFTWHYVLPSAAPLSVLVAASLGGRGGRGGAGPLARLRRRAAGTVAVAALALSLLNVASRGSEDFPGAVRRVLELHSPGDGVIAVEWQPTLFPQGMPWDYYAPRLARTPPERLPMAGFNLANPSALEGLGRVVLLRSSLPDDQPLMDLLRREFVPVTEENFGFGRDVLVFER